MIELQNRSFTAGFALVQDDTFAYRIRYVWANRQRDAYMEAISFGTNR